MGISKEAKAAYDRERRLRFKAEHPDWSEIERRQRAALSGEQKEQRRARSRAWRAENAERFRADQRRRREAGYFRAWYRRRRDADPTFLPRQRLTRTALRYGISPDRYTTLLAAQAGVCAICNQPETMEISGTVASLAVDHDRRCCPGKKSCGACVRGLLCVRCNMALGGVKENPTILRAMADYIERYAS